MNSIKLKAIENMSNKGIAKEHALCAFFGINRERHDNTDYRTSSDIIMGERRISVKSSGFTLMNSTLCEDKETLSDIWNVYETNTNANEVAYITNDFTAYFMTIKEFKTFVEMFCRVERDSTKNGGKMKIRCKHESSKMRVWFELSSP